MLLVVAFLLFYSDITRHLLLVMLFSYWFVYAVDRLSEKTMGSGVPHTVKAFNVVVDWLIAGFKWKD